jgi:hypothetical protein
MLHPFLSGEGGRPSGSTRGLAASRIQGFLGDFSSFHLDSKNILLKEEGLETLSHER